MYRLLTAALLALVLAAAPAHAQPRRWHDLTPDTLRQRFFRVVRAGYSGTQRYLYAGGDRGEILRSTDGGASWRDVRPPTIKGFGFNNAVVHLAVWPGDARLVYAITNAQLFKSRDAGDTWTELTANLDRRTFTRLEFTRVELSPFDSSKVFIAAGIHFEAYSITSTDGGRSWDGDTWEFSSEGTNANVVPSPSTADRVFFYAHNGGSAARHTFVVSNDWGGRYALQSFDRVYALSDPEHLQADEDEVLYSQYLISFNQGRSWSDTRRGDMSWAFNAVATRGDVVYGTRIVRLQPDQTRYEVTYDRGGTWRSLDAPFPYRLGLAYSHDVDEADSTLYVAGTDGLFAYGRPGTVGVGIEEYPATPLAGSLASYPNPFRDQVTVQVTLPDAGALRLEVYDVLGRRVRALHGGDAPGGVSQYGWDGRDEAGAEVAPGVYVLRSTSEAATGARRTVKSRTMVKNG